MIKLYKVWASTIFGSISSRPFETYIELDVPEDKTATEVFEAKYPNHKAVSIVEHKKK